MSQAFGNPATTLTLNPGLSWLSIVRLGLVQAALGAIVVLTTSTLNRVMIVELGLAERGDDAGVRRAQGDRREAVEAHPQLAVQRHGR
mgnify:CR=1 FL=1